MNTDNQIIMQVEGILTHDPRVEMEKSSLEILCNNGTVTLSGAVPTVPAKRLARRYASSIDGVHDVIDLVRVTPPNPMGDLEIAEHIRHAFIQERNIEEQNITLDVDPKGGVTLSGQVRSLIQKRLCEVLCWWIPGVTEVHNAIAVVPHEEDNDEELKDNLMVIMEKDALVDPKKFRIDTHDGVVTLTGHVDSETEKDAAEKDCWYTPGVVEVDNQLTI